MNLAVALTTFAVIFPAELPDKSLFASLVLGTRFRPLPVFIGVAAAFGVHVVIAVAIGGVFALLPQRLVLFVAAALFAGGAAWLLLDRADDGDAAETSRAASDAGQGSLRIALASFGVVFVGEWGDITQLTTANLAARYGDPVSVGMGALLALWTVTALALTLGRGLVRRIPARLVRRLTGVVLTALAAITLIEAVRG